MQCHFASESGYEKAKTSLLRLRNVSDLVGAEECIVNLDQITSGICNNNEIGRCSNTIRQL